MKKIIFALLLCTLFYQTEGQTIKILGIGDTLPSINVQIINGDQIETRSLSSFYKNTFLILDFWANWCGPCITAIADADSVARKFNGLVSVLPITYQDSGTIWRFIKNNSILGKLNLNYVINDSILMGNQIKFDVLPHEVWVDTNGIIKAITYSDEITYENLDSFVNEKSLALNEKEDVLDFDATKPLEIDNSSILYRSVLASYKDGLSNMMGSLTRQFANDKIDRFFAINTDILTLFYAAYSCNQAIFYENRVELYLKDTLILNPFFVGSDVSRNFLKKHTYCYELILPEKITQDTFYTYLMNDLNRLFPFTASIEKRKKECLVLVNKFINKNPVVSKRSSKLIWKSGLIERMENQSMNNLAFYLNWNMKLPVVNETSFDKKFDINLSVSAFSDDEGTFLDITETNKSLKIYGFELIKAERFIDILVIREK